MALTVGTLVANLEIDRKGFDRDLRRVEGDSEKAGSRIGNAFRGLGGLGGVLAATGAVAFLSSTKDAASDLSETVSKTGVIFGRNAADVLRWSEGSAKAFGLSRQQALAAATSFGDMFTQLGFTGQAATDNSKAIVQMAADLGSFHNVDPSDVLDRISGAMRGEYDSLQQLIPNINAARVETEAMAMTGKTAASQLTAQEKATATLAIIQRDGAAAAGDFARTSEGAANQQRIAAAQVENLQAALGQKLLPAYAAVLGFITGTVLPGLEDLGGLLSRNSDDIQTVAKVIGAVLVPALVVWGTTAAVNAAKAAAAWLLAQASALKSAAVQVASAARVVASWVVLGVQSLAQAARVAAAWVVAMGPVGWVIATVVGLVALIIANWDTVKRVTGAAWDWVTSKLGAAWDWIKRTVGDALVWVVSTIVGKWGEARDWTARTWDAIRAAVDSAWARVKDLTHLAVLWIVDRMAWWAERVIGAADAAFGWIPGLGGKLEDAKRAVQAFREKTNAEMDAIRDKNIAVKVGVNGAWSMQNNGLGRVIGNVPEFASGGYTGPGGRRDPAGIVHAGEVVWSQADVAAHGGPQAVDRLRRMRGFADGGIVGDLSPRARRAGALAREGARLVTADALPRIAAEAAKALAAVPRAPFPGSSSGLIPVMAAMRRFVMETWGVRNIGGYANRNIAGTNRKSDHAAGKAIDVMVGSNKRLGDSIAAYFTSPAGRAAWPVDNVIWYRRIWNARRGHWRPYGGEHPHTDHPHIDTFDRGGIMRGLGANLSGRAERVLSPEQTRAFERLVEVLDRGSLQAVRSQPVPVEKHLHYHAATGRSLPEEDFFDAAGRARMLGW